MKILMISDLAPPVVTGGIENYIVNLSKELIRDGHEVHWLTSRLPDTLPEEDFEGIKIHRVCIPFSGHYMFPGRQMFFLTSLIKGIKLAKKMDVVHVNTLVPGFLGWLIAKYSGRPSLLFCHEFYGSLWKKVGQNLFEKYVYPIFEKLTSTAPYDWFACPSIYSKQSLRNYGIPDKKITVIPHGVDRKLFNESNNPIDYKNKYGLSNNPIFGYLGRLSTKGTGQAKNLISLLEATKFVVEKIPNAKLVLGGSGFEHLTKHIVRFNVKKNVVNVGRIPKNNGPSFLKMCDVVVCPAVSDGFCFLLAEASACGIPVVGTNRGSHEERIENNKNGIITDVDPQSLANGIIKILQDPEFGNKLGKNGIAFTKDLDRRDSAKKHVEIYKKLLNEHSHTYLK